MKHIIIFKTSLQDNEDLYSIKDVLNNVFGEKNWSMALDDIDKILRVVSYTACKDLVIQILKSSGFQCEELPYDLG